MSKHEISFPAECHDCGEPTVPHWEETVKMYVVCLVEELRLLDDANDYFVCCKKCSTVRAHEGLKERH